MSTDVIRQQPEAQKPTDVASAINKAIKARMEVGNADKELFSSIGSALSEQAKKASQYMADAGEGAVMMAKDGTKFVGKKVDGGVQYMADAGEGAKMMAKDGVKLAGNTVKKGAKGAVRFAYNADDNLQKWAGVEQPGATDSNRTETVSKPKESVKKVGEDISQKITNLGKINTVSDLQKTQLEDIFKSSNPAQKEAILAATKGGNLNVINLQKTLGTKPDGVIGNETITKLKAFGKTPATSV